MVVRAQASVYLGVASNNVAELYGLLMTLLLLRQLLRFIVQST